MADILIALQIPNGMQLFQDYNGVPLDGGRVYMYVPGTTTFKDTWQDPAEGIRNSNPIVLDGAGRCVIWGVGQYRQLVRDKFGNIIWDKLTFAGTATGDGGGGGPPVLDIPDGSITTQKLADGSVTTVKLGDASVTERILANGSVTTSKIGDATVTTEKLFDKSVTTAKIGDAAVTTTQIGDSAVTTAKIGDAQVTTQKVGDDAITSAKMEFVGGSVMDELYVRGAGNNNPASNRVIVGGRVDVNNTNRGLTLTVLRRSDHAQLAYWDWRPNTYVSSTYFDTYSEAGTGNIQPMIDSLQELRTNSHGSAQTTAQNMLIIVTSYDAWENQGQMAALAAELKLHGATEAFLEQNDSGSARAPYLLIGVPGIGEGRGIEILNPPIPGIWAEYDGILVDGNLPGLGGLAPGVISTVLLRAGSVVADKIGAGAIVAGKIAADAVTAGTIAAGAVVAGSIASGAVTTNALAAGSVTTLKIASAAITTSKLAVSGPGAALNSDPGMTDAESWAPGNPNWQSIHTTGAPAGDIALYTTAANQQVINEPYFPVDHMKTYRIRGWIGLGNNDSPNYFYLGAAFKDENGSNVDGSPYWGTYWYYAASGAHPGGGWNLYQHVFGAGQSAPYHIPAEAKTMAPVAIVNYGGPGGSAYLQDIRIEEVLPSTLIQDGAITTDKIQARAVTVSKMGFAGPGAALNSDPTPLASDSWVGGANNGYVLSTGTLTGATSGYFDYGMPDPSYALYNKPPVAVDPSKTYRFHANWYNDAGTTNGLTYMGVDLWDSDGNHVTSPGLSQWWYAVNGAPPTGGVWNTIDSQFGAGTSQPIPGNARTMMPFVLGNYQGDGASHGFYFNDIRIEEALPSTLIQDGSINTSKITAGSITADKIVANTIQTIHLVGGATTGLAYEIYPDLNSITHSGIFIDFSRCNYTSTGGPCIVTSSFYCRNDDNTTHGIFFRMVRVGPGVRLWPPAFDTQAAFTVRPSEGFTVNINVTDQPGPGAYTWVVQYQSYDSPNIRLIYPYLRVEEVKR